MRSIRSISFLTLFLALFLLSACAEENKGPANIIQLPEGAPDEQGDNTTIILSDSNWTKAIMQVGHVRKYNSRLETLIDSGLFIRFLDRDGALNATLRADSARIDDKTGNMCAYGRVHVYSEKNKTTVDTEIICYDKATARLHSDSWVHLVDNLRGRNLQGIGFESDEALRDCKIYQVSGEASGGK